MRHFRKVKYIGQPYGNMKNYADSINLKAVEFTYTFVAVIFIASSILILRLAKCPGRVVANQENGGTWAQRKQSSPTTPVILCRHNDCGHLGRHPVSFASCQTQGDCDDIRIVYQPNATTFTELSCYVVNASSCATSGATKVNFLCRLL